MSSITTLSTSRPAPLSWVESLFSRMEAMYGAKFLDMWRGVDMVMVKNMWADEMGKLSAEDLKRGFSALMARDWPPSLPEYVKMCRPSVDPTVAYYEAVSGNQARERGERGEWSHPAIFWAAASMAYDLKHQGYSALKPRWEKVLAEQMEKGEWPTIPEALLALPEPGKGKADREHAEKMIAEYKAGEVAKPRGTDHRAWIGKILERQKRKDDSLPGISIRFAKEAMQVRPG